MRLMKKLTPLLISFLIPLLALTTEASAITIDSFDGVAAIGAQVSSSQSIGSTSTRILGDSRVLRAEGITGLPGLQVRLQTAGGLLTHSQEVTMTGRTSVTWDGDALPTLNTLGLRSLNLTEDGATAFRLGIVSFDFPGNQPILISVKIYDVSDATGARASEVTAILDRKIEAILKPDGSFATTAFDIPFSAFTKAVGATAAARMSNVGAITLTIDGMTPDHDIAIDFIGTNGVCALVPTLGSKVVDLCGVCGGDSSSCKDCAGVPLGTSKVDRCNQCGGDGFSCISCSEYDQSPTLTTLDGGAKKQEKVIMNLVKMLVAKKKDSKTKTYADKTLKVAHELQIRNWILSWTLPRMVRSCTSGAQFCSKSSNIAFLDEYRTHAQELLTLTNEVATMISGKGKAHSKSVAKLIDQGKKLYDANVALSYKVPVEQYASCN